MQVSGQRPAVFDVGELPSSLGKSNSAHVIVADGGRVSIVAINGDAAPGRAFDRALVLHVALPENAVSWLQLSRAFLPAASSLQNCNFGCSAEHSSGHFVG